MQKPNIKPVSYTHLDVYKRQELYRQKMEEDSMMKNGFSATVKQEDAEEEEAQPPNSDLIDNKTLLNKNLNDFELDNASFLQEYDVNNSIPELKYGGVAKDIVDRQENATVRVLLELENQKPSALLTNRTKGYTPKLNKNISLIQEIRHICHKISLIRLLQNPAFLQNSKNANNPNSFLNSHQYKYSSIDDSIDLDPISQLPTHDYRSNKKVMWEALYKNVAKIAMTNGFESTQPSAVNMLTEIAGNYISNLIKTVKLHNETNSLNRSNANEILHMSLLENGINKPDDLYTYVESEFEKKTRKLTDLKAKLENFLKDLLRPSLQELSERNFEDESQSFLTGDFANELTGEDFFGFKELGLEKEFGVLSSSVPLQLLTSQFQATGDVAKVQEKKIQSEEVDGVVYSKVTNESINNMRSWSTLLPLLEKAQERSRNYTSKTNKGAASDTNVMEETDSSKSYTLLEDDEMVFKQKTGNKIRLPPTGKISTAYKKKPLDGAFIAVSYTHLDVYKRQHI